MVLGADSLRGELRMLTVLLRSTTTLGEKAFLTAEMTSTQAPFCTRYDGNNCHCPLLATINAYTISECLHQVEDMSFMKGSLPKVHA